MSEIMTPDAGEFLNAKTVSDIKVRISGVQVLMRQFTADYYPDGETREDFYDQVHKRMRALCDAMADNILIISKYSLHQHEYAKEVMDVSIDCYREARTLAVRIEARLYGNKKGAA